MINSTKYMNPTFSFLIFKKVHVVRISILHLIVTYADWISTFKSIINSPFLRFTLLMFSTHRGFSYTSNSQHILCLLKFNNQRTHQNANILLFGRVKEVVVCNYKLRRVEQCVWYKIKSFYSFHLAKKRNHLKT